MAGNKKNPDIPLGGVKSFSCPGCGGQVEVRAPGQTLSAACSHCGSFIDTSDENYQIIARYNAKMTFQPRIPFGRRGKVDGITWECIGFMMREETKWKYRWEEYLLFNPWHGFAWLALSDGHWTFIRSIMDLPDSDKQTAYYEGEKYSNFDNYTGKAIYVVGEFNWKLTTGEQTKLRDYIAPPYILSKEGNANENIWSKGVYIERSEVMKAFAVDKLPAKQGVAPNQPNPYAQPWKQIKPVFLGFLAILVAAQIFFGISTPSKQVFFEKMTSEAGLETKLIPEIEVPGNIQNLEAKLYVPLSNDWFGLEGTLVNLDTQEKFGFYTGAEYYSGVTDGESWSEGSLNNSVVLNNIPGGKYSLTLKPYKNIEGKAYDFQITLKRGVGIFSNFLLILILTSIVPIFLAIAKTQFEAKRFADQ